jgi:osmotically-inducible protein OsmY
MLIDSQLQQAVLAELKWEPSVTAAHIGVTAKGGVVAITGHVESYVEKHAAETAAGRVKGVKAVAEEIEVRLSLRDKAGRRRNSSGGDRAVLVGCFGSA